MGSASTTPTALPALLFACDAVSDSELSAFAMPVVRSLRDLLPVAAVGDVRRSRIRVTAEGTCADEAERQCAATLGPRERQLTRDVDLRAAELCVVASVGERRRCSSHRPRRNCLWAMTPMPTPTYTIAAMPTALPWCPSPLVRVRWSTFTTCTFSAVASPVVALLSTVLGVRARGGVARERRRVTRDRTGEQAGADRVARPGNERSHLEG